MKVPYTQPQSGCYRLARGVHIHGETLVCDYPLRVLRPGATILRLIEYCGQERSCAELAVLLKLPVKRVEVLCEQLYWKGVLDTGARIAPQTWPGVSVIIPTYNRAEQLARCLASLLNLDYPAICMEIIVVDDASSDGTSAMLAQFAGECEAQHISLRVVRHTLQKGGATSRNSGAEQARMELLAFIDSDCVATPGWLKELVPVFEDRNIGAVGGMIRAYERRTMPGKYEDVCSSLFMGARTQQVKLEGPLTYLPTANFLARRGALQKVGGFASIPFGEDVDFCRRLLLSGSAMRYEPRGIVLHDYRTDWLGFLKTRVSYASAEAVLLQRHPTERRVLLLPPEQATFAALVIGGLFGVFRLFRRGGGGVDVGRGRLRRPPGWGMGIMGTGRGRRKRPLPTRPHPRPYGTIELLTTVLFFILAAIFALVGARKRLVAVRQQRVGLHPLVVLRATLRGYLAYVYHLCRHLTRYYTLPMLLVGVVLPPLLLLTFILCSVVIGVDYARLRPRMTLGRFVFCSLLNDCAYEIGVLLGCIKQRMWKPLVPVIKK